MFALHNSAQKNSTITTAVYNNKNRAKSITTATSSSSSSNNNNNNNSVGSNYVTSSCSTQQSNLDAMTSQPWYPAASRTSYNFIIETPPSNSREMRNKAEKQRRDRLNSFISELATLVPLVSRSPKKLDKTSILRLTATHLRLYQTLLNSGRVPNMEMPKQVDQSLLEQLVCDELGGFMLILTSTGKIVFVSNTIETLLGHLQTDLMGQSLFSVVSPEDHDRLRLYLQCEGDVEQEWRKYFTIHIKRAGPRSESAVYEPVRMMGVHKQFTNGRTSPTSSVVSDTSGSSTANGELMIFFVKICRPETFVDKLVESSKDEYITRHLIDGRIINCDQRISLVAGYMTEEVSGKSAFLYMHRDDVRWVMIALRQMYDRGESKGNSCYRLKSRNGQFIYLRTFGFLEIDSQGTVESFVCINSLVSEKEGLNLINDMKRKFATIIPLGEDVPAISNGNSLTSPFNNFSDPCATDLVEDPQRVHEAVSYLMRNLPSPGNSDDDHNPNNDALTSSSKKSGYHNVTLASSAKRCHSNVVLTSPTTSRISSSISGYHSSSSSTITSSSTATGYSSSSMASPTSTVSVTSPLNSINLLLENEDCKFDIHEHPDLIKQEFIQLSELNLSPPIIGTVVSNNKCPRGKNSNSKKRSASTEEFIDTTRSNGIVKRPKLSPPPPQMFTPIHRPTLTTCGKEPPLIATKNEKPLYPQEKVLRHEV